MTWLLILAIIGLTLVLGVVFLELLIRWVSLARVQTAAKEASLVYARDMVRLRDNCLSQSNSKDLSFQSAGIPQSCDATGGGSICGCTALKGQAASIPGANTMEFLNASQTLLYNVWGKRIADPKEVDNVQQSQCYKPYSDQRFSKIQSPEPTCVVTGKVTSPITDLKWEFRANPYGTGLCCASGSASDNAKDFCVDVRVTGRMDPIMAGGLPFLSAKGIFDPAASAANGRSPMRAVEFITVGGFEIHARAVVNKMSSKESTGDDSLTQNLSGETIQLEDIPKGASCGAAPQVVPTVPNPLTPPTPGALSLPPLPPLPPSEIDPTAPPVDPKIDPPPEVVPNCPAGMIVGQIINRSAGGVDYICSPPPTPCPTAATGRSCSGNTIVETYGVDRTSPSGLCGQATRTIQDCSNGCSNGVCNPPPPPCVYAVYRNRTSANANVWDIVPLLDTMISKGLTRPLNGIAVDSAAMMGFYGAQSLQSFGITGKRLEAWEYIAHQMPQLTTLLSQFNAWSSVANNEKLKNTAFYVDNNGTYLGTNNTAVNVCGTIMVESPISLILSDQIESISASQFSLGNSKGWYRWKASSSRPLLAYDPKHQGQITSASQLFGNYTFSKQWSNGYEALETLDLNHDNKIAGHELKDLALWFDENQNGISEKGEVKRLSEVGVTKLFFNTNKTDLETGDIHASIGYERCIKGKCSIGASVDWYGEGPFDTKEEALLCKHFVAGFGFVKTEKHFVGRN